jgi:hypothetical protein
VKAVSTSRGVALKATVTVTGATVNAGGTMQTVTGDSLEAANGFRTPRAVACALHRSRAVPGSSSSFRRTRYAS